MKPQRVGRHLTAETKASTDVRAPRAHFLMNSIIDGTRIKVATSFHSAFIEVFF
jgi:hypothetical protein